MIKYLINPRKVVLPFSPYSLRAIWIDQSFWPSGIWLCQVETPSSRFFPLIIELIDVLVIIVRQNCLEQFPFNSLIFHFATMDRDGKFAFCIFWLILINWRFQQ